MLSQNVRKIDARWNAIKPKKWRENFHGGERQMLYDILDDDEDIDNLIGGTFKANTDRFHPHQGIAVATSKRVVCLAKGLFGSGEVKEIAYRNIEGITFNTGIFMARMQITGRGMARYRIEDIREKNSVKPFVDCVRAHLEVVSAQPGHLAQGSAADEIEKLAGLLRRRLITQDEFDAKKKQLLGL
jgi:hypothetical protein